MAVSWDTTNPAINVSISDNKGNTYSAATSKHTDDRHGQALQVFYVTDANGGSSHTFTATPSQNTCCMRMSVHEVSGIASSNPVDTSAYVTNESGTGVSVGPMTTTQDGDYIFAVADNDSGSNTISGNSPYTQRAIASPYKLQTQDYVQSSAGSVSSTWTMSGTNDAIAQIVGFKAAQ